MLFDDDVHREAFDALCRRRRRPPRRRRRTSGPDAAELLARLAVEASDAEAADVASRLVDRAARRALAAPLEREARHADDPLDYAATIGWLKLRLEELREDPDRRIQPADSW